MVTTFLLFEIDKDLDAWILSMCLAVFVPHFFVKEHPTFRYLRVFLAIQRWSSGPSPHCGVARQRCLSSSRTRRVLWPGRRLVEVDKEGLVYIDGLWHSVLFRDDDREAKSTENGTSQDADCHLAVSRPQG